MENTYSQLVLQNKSLPLSEFKREFVMEDFIQGFPNVLKLEHGDEVVVLKNQLGLLIKDEKKGRIDLLVSYNKETLAVAELKKDVLTVNDFVQLKKYFSNRSSLDKIAKDAANQLNGIVCRNWVGILVGPGISLELAQFINKDMQKMDFSFAVIALKRFRANGEEGVVSEVYVNQEVRRSKIKYIVDGGDPLPINRFALFVFKKYCNLYPNSDFSQIKKYFGGYGFFLGKSHFQEFNSIKHRKTDFFLESEDLFNLPEGKPYALKNFWYADEVKPLVEVAKSFGCSVVTE